jgi:hypothetical protein
MSAKTQNTETTKANLIETILKINQNFTFDYLDSFEIETLKNIVENHKDNLKVKDSKDKSNVIVNVLNEVKRLNQNEFTKTELISIVRFSNRENFLNFSKSNLEYNVHSDLNDVLKEKINFECLVNQITSNLKRDDNSTSAFGKWLSRSTNYINSHIAGTKDSNSLNVHKDYAIKCTYDKVKQLYIFSEK